MNSINQQSGYIVLMAVIVMGTVAVTSAIAVLTLSVQQSQTTKAVEQHNQAKGLANACAEFALDALHLNPAYSGNETILLGSGQCTIMPISLVAEIATIQSLGTVEKVVRKVKATAQVTTVTVGELPAAQVTTTTVQLRSWQEVADF